MCLFLTVKLSELRLLFCVDELLICMNEVWAGCANSVLKRQKNCVMFKLHAHESQGHCWQRKSKKCETSCDTGNNINVSLLDMMLKASIKTTLVYTFSFTKQAMTLLSVEIVSWSQNLSIYHRMFL